MLTPANVHIDSALTSLTIGYPGQQGFVADFIAPVVPVQKKSDYYFVHGQEHLDNHSTRTKRNSDGSYSFISHAYTNDSYNCEDYGLSEFIADTVVANQDEALDVFADAAFTLRENMLIAREARVKAAVAAAAPTTDTAIAAAGDKWSDPSSDPVSQILADRKAIIELTGALPNRMMISQDVFNALQVHDGILDRIKYTGTNAAPGMVTKQMLAALFQVDEIAVASAIYNSANQGQNRSMTAFYTGTVLLFVAATRPSLRASSYAVQMNWVAPELGGQLAVLRIPDEKKFGTQITVREFMDEKITGQAFAARRTSVVA